MEKNGYKRSNSRNGFCGAAPSAQRYVKIEMDLDLEVNQVEQDLTDHSPNQEIELDLKQDQKVITQRMWKKLKRT